MILGETEYHVPLEVYKANQQLIDGMGIPVISNTAFPLPSASFRCVLSLVCLTGCADRSLLGAGPDGRRAVDRLLEGFGPENLYVELQRPYARHDRARNRAFSELARRLGIRCVASGNVHAHTPTRAELQDAFVALANRTTLDASEPLRRGNHSHVMSTPRAMASRFADHPQAVRETLALAERLRFDLTRDLGYRYPGAEEQDAPAALGELCQMLWRTATRRCPARHAPTARRSDAWRRS